MPTTANQQRSLEAVLTKVQEYMNLRFQQVARVNSRIEAVWDDLVWVQMTRLRTSINGEKAFGPVRFHVAETMLGDDLKMIREFYSTKSQASLQGELVEERESEAHKTHGTMEVHDMRTLCRAIDPTLESIASLIQTFMWWDLEDAVDIARCDRKISNVTALEKQELTPEMAEAYKKKMHTTEKVDNAMAIGHECRVLQKTVKSFALRRREERGHQVIIARESKPNEDSHRLIEAIASQNQLLRSLHGGSELDQQVKGNIAKAMNVSPEDLTQEKAVSFLEKTAANNKIKLRQVLVTGGTGEAYNYKQRQLEDLEKRLKDTIGDRNIEPPSSSEQA